jgi:hypothetical protein
MHQALQPGDNRREMPPESTITCFCGVFMKIKPIICCALAILIASTAQAADVGFNLNLNVGNRSPVIPIPVIPRPPAFMIPSPPVFLVPPGLGFSVAIDIPYDMVYIEGRYYLYDGGAWHMGRNYNGPWRPVSRKYLPYGLRKHKHQEIINYRDQEYRNYRNRNHGNDKGRDQRKEKDHGKSKNRH